MLVLSGSAEPARAPLPFGKPTYALFTFAQLLTLAVTAGETVDEWGRLRLDDAGGPARSSFGVPFIDRWRARLRWYAARDICSSTGISRAPSWHIYLRRRTDASIASSGRACRSMDSLGLYPGYFGPARDARASSRASLIALKPHRSTGSFRVALLAVDAPRRSLGIASVVAADAKGFPYHFHPDKLGPLRYEGLVDGPAGSAEQHRTPAEHDPADPRSLPARRPVRGRGAALAPRRSCSTLLTSARTSSNLVDPPEGPIDAQSFVARSGLPRLLPDTADFFPMGDAARPARVSQGSTRVPSDRVQVYGMDPYLLFLADRLSATPYIYAYDLECRHGAHGLRAFRKAKGSIRPWPQDGAASACHPRWRTSETCFAQRAGSRLPPKFVVFMDHSPLITWQDAHDDFDERVTLAAAWVDAHYPEVQSFGTVRIWERRDDGPSASGG